MMKIAVNYQDFDTPLTFSGRPSDLKWLGEKLIAAAKSAEGSLSLSIVLAPDDEWAARHAAEERLWEDQALQRAQEILAKRVQESLNGTELIDEFWQEVADRYKYKVSE
jgi:hypothetical protein